MVIACIVMAYIVTVYMVLAYIAMAVDGIPPSMAYIVTPIKLLPL